jgi:RNA polymerase sigma-70 factor (ECF subfamily)
MSDRARETELIEAFKSGNSFAFDQLVELYRQRAYSLAYRWVENREDALDICQEAFLRMFKALRNWRPRSSIFTWLYRVIINLSIDLKRKRNRERSVRLASEADDPPHGIVPVAPFEQTPWRAADLKELAGGIREAAMQLPKRQQKAFVLRFYEGLQLREIAEVMECSVGAAKATLFHAVRKMRKMLATEWEKRERRSHELQAYQTGRQVPHLGSEG